MPCPCEIKNGTNLLQPSGTLIGIVLGNGSQCFKPDNMETSTAIGNVNFDPEEKYTYKRILTKSETAQTCYRKSESIIVFQSSTSSFRIRKIEKAHLREWPTDHGVDVCDAGSRRPITLRIIQFSQPCQPLTYPSYPRFVRNYENIISTYIYKYDACAKHSSVYSSVGRAGDCRG